MGFSLVAAPSTHRDNKNGSRVFVPSVCHMRTFDSCDQVHDVRAESDSLHDKYGHLAWEAQYKEWGHHHRYREEHFSEASSSSRSGVPGVKIIREVNDTDNKKSGPPSVLNSTEYMAMPAGTVVEVEGVQYQMSRAGKWWPRTINRGGAGAKSRFNDQQRHLTPPPPPWKRSE